MRVIKDGDTLKVELTNGEFTTISKEDDWIIPAFHRWSKESHGYVMVTRQVITEYGSTLKESLILHRLILYGRYIRGNYKDSVDHKDRNKLNNTRENLRHSTRSQNSANIPAQPGKKFKSVLYNTRRGKYYASIQVEKYVRKHLGFFSTAEEAARAYDKEAKRIWGEFAFLNFPNET
jgi:hypothetical protein